MKPDTPQRKSHCTVCGKRLSEKTSTGAIHWEPSLVDDKGIYCETCKKALVQANGKKKKRS